VYITVFSAELLALCIQYVPKVEWSRNGKWLRAEGAPFQSRVSGDMPFDCAQGRL
jgi:hypothetical protein